MNLAISFIVQKFVFFTMYLYIDFFVHFYVFTYIGIECWDKDVH